MKTVNLIQGTPEWRAHRANYHNASDAPAMLGVSPYKTREQLIREVATGVVPEVDAATQRRFDDGHRYEALARPIAEAIIGEDLFPCVGVEGKYSASFDGLTLMEDVAFEHKTLNADLAELVWLDDGSHLPLHYQVQMEHQAMVSGAQRVLFMASKWAGEELIEERHCWYTPNPELRAKIIAGWEQFEADVMAYQPAQAQVPAATGRAPEQLPALRVEVTGMVTASNLAEFKAGAMAVLGGINRDLQTDEDFANADETVKWCKGVEERLELTKQQVLSQTADIEAVFRTMDEVSAETRRVRLDLDRLVKAEKERRRAEIVAEAIQSVRAHHDGINASLGEHALLMPASVQAAVAEAIKGKKTLTSIRDAASTAAAGAKIDASQIADRVRANIAILADHSDHAHLFADRVQLCASKSPDDLRNLVTARIAEHQRQEEARQEAQRERIRQEELAKIERERAAAEQADAAAEREKEAEMPSSTAQQLEPDIIEQAPPADAPAARSNATVKLGEINARIAPLSITVDGLAKLGFQPVASERAAKLYAESDLIAIYRAMYSVIQAAATNQQKAA